MEGILLAAAGWAGRNLGNLTMAAAIAAGTAVLGTALWRKHRERVRLLAISVFFAVFGYRTATVTAGWVLYLRPEDRGQSALAFVAVIAVSAGALAAVVRLGSRRRLAVTVGVLGTLLIGQAMPVSERLLGPRPTDSAQVSRPMAVPLDYPTVAIWASESEGFAVLFPEEPTRIEASSAQASGYSYQSAFEFADGGASALVSIARVPFPLDSASERAFLEGAHAGFVQSLGARGDSARKAWASLANGTPILRYEVSFLYEGVPIRGIGFWIVSRQRALRVSVAYPAALSRESAVIAEHFLNTFMLLGPRTAATRSP